MRIFLFSILFCLQALASDSSVAIEYIRHHPEIFRPDHPEVLSKLRKEVGDDLSKKIMDYFIKEIIVQNRTCESFIGTCDFYLCQELKNPCGLEGYNLSYGYKYCSRSKFKLLYEMKTTAGKDWVPKTFQCLERQNLMDSLAIQQQNDLKKDTCKSIRKLAFKSHPDCYVEAGYCELSHAEQSNIIRLVFYSALKPSGVIQGLKLLDKCQQKKIRD